MSDKQISVSQFSTPLLEFLMTNFRSEANPSEVVDITGYTIKLAVKNSIEDPDSYELFDLEADLDADPTSGKYSFSMTTEHTCFSAGTYFGEIRWWASGLTPSTDPPSDRLTVDYKIQSAVDITL